MSGAEPSVTLSNGMKGHLTCHGNIRIYGKNLSTAMLHPTQLEVLGLNYVVDSQPEEIEYIDIDPTYLIGRAIWGLPNDKIDHVGFNGTVWTVTTSRPGIGSRNFTINPNGKLKLVAL